MLSPEISIEKTDLGARVQADLADLLHANVPGNMAGSLWATLAATWLLSDGAPGGSVAVWIVAQLALCTLAMAAAWRVRRRPTTARNAERRVRAAANGSLMFGLLWSAGVFLLWQPDQFDGQVLLMFLIVGLTSGALHAQMASRRAFLGFFIPCLLSVLVCAVRNPGAHAAVIFVSVLVYGGASIRVAILMHRTLIDSLRRRHEIEALAADLRLQKERAEAANLSKSRFLAAASHDLRQPIHALSLFAAALGYRPLDPEAARIAARMQDAVEGMSHMFNGLLDVSRLDAGAVEVRPRVFELRRLLARIVADEDAVARAKGIQIRLRCEELMAETDPLLLERIVRNLVTNAVRYTNQGGVLVAARKLAGEIVLRVVDTGIGIAPESQAAVFAEFVQLDNPEQAQDRGLGLGLSIVSRLTALLSIRLTMNSRPNRGSTFVLRLPLGAQPELMPSALASAQPNVPAVASGQALGGARGELVLVVDDDEATRAAMESLLAAWGYTVLSAPGLADLTPQLMRLKAAPVLIISDLQLRDTESGTEVVAQLREWFNDKVPAIIVTGETAPDRLHAVSVMGLHVLTKPLTNQALLAAMREVLG